MRWHPCGVSPDVAGYGRVGSVQMRSGRLRCVAVKANDLSAEGFGPLRWVLWNSDVVSMGLDRQVEASSGPAGTGVARTGEDCKRQYGGLRPSLLLFREQMRQGGARRGTARRGTDGCG